MKSIYDRLKSQTMPRNNSRLQYLHCKKDYNYLKF